ncbi:MAG: ABC transporter ATP-binding protein [Herminiimonas sp.]|nr:ABC transporter ATP-binding protein [Herminiimonas sp.]
MLTASGLNAFYGDSHMLHDVALQITAGCAVGLLGRNGMGKTTLIRTLLGFVPAASGEIRWHERAVTGSTPERMARLGIGYVPEGRGIFPNLSVRENLVMSARAGVDGRREWTLERVLALFPRLAERLTHGGTQLSGGEQQMLSISRALMTNPTLLILDEATEGLAPLIVREIWQVIAEVSATGVGTLIVDRDYRAVLRHTTQAIILEKGRVVIADASAKLLQAPRQITAYLGV